jgi:hypothetical protein
MPQAERCHKNEEIMIRSVVKAMTCQEAKPCQQESHFLTLMYRFACGIRGI